MDDLEDARRLRRETDRQRINLIEVDIDVAMTFLRIPVTELSMGHPERVDRLLSKARRAHEMTAKFLTEVEDLQQRQYLDDKHQALTEAVWGVERRKLRHQQEDP